MPALNRYEVMGHVGREPEIKTFDSGQSVAEFSVATTESWKDKATGEWKEQTEWHNIKAWGRSADQAAKLLKGDLVLVAGKHVTEKWEKDGQPRSKAVLKADRVYFLRHKNPKGDKASDDGPADDDLPF